MGTLTSWNPLGHSRPLTGLLYLSIYIITETENTVTRQKKDVSTVIVICIGTGNM